jgi:Predicted sugar kinase
MMLLAGTVPIRDLPLTTGEVKTDGNAMIVGRCQISPAQGTGAMIGAALAVTDYLKLEPPKVAIAGDTGRGEGSRSIYDYLIQNISHLEPDVLVLHYCLPDMVLVRRLCQAVDSCSKRPIMVADAASMYAAKATGLASRFDIFTPDATEMAFLADPDAIHPAYINKHLFDTDMEQIPELVSTTYRQGNAAKLLIVKGKSDYVVKEGEIVATIEEPIVPELEAIGGTGDTITGLVSAFVHAELELHEAAIIASKSNRMAGKVIQVTPATRIGQIIEQFPLVFQEYLCAWSGVCYMEKGESND